MVNITYRGQQYEWNYGGLIDNMGELNINININIEDILNNKEDIEFIIENITWLNDFTKYKITKDVINVLNYLQINFLEELGNYLIENNINFGLDFEFPLWISKYMSKNKNILKYLQNNTIHCNEIYITLGHIITDELLINIKQTERQCITIIADSCYITDKGLEGCIYLKELNANDNKKITTCKPFCKTLIKLSACCDCGIDDEGLEGCIKLQMLDSRYNNKITTCKPVCNTLINIVSLRECEINDEGIKECINLQ